MLAADKLIDYTRKISQRLTAEMALQLPGEFSNC